ncbi:hypothetical protein Hypma_006129 [Hypsizygus marmoreus]|uniref:Uncharacterized protein n=1 Tax=Hypsizygus marmoreus TaxID=39966 RepID=A0A369JV09_HYPMA|nr:hypothetical protein Hypma_006129 [Hypsizygus marmoreus]
MNFHSYPGSYQTCLIGATAKRFCYWNPSGRVDYSPDQLLHNKPLLYYPPSVSAGASFELAARGYSPRVDSYRHDKLAARTFLLWLAMTLRSISALVWSEISAMLDRYDANVQKMPYDDVSSPVAQKNHVSDPPKWLRQYDDARSAFQKCSWFLLYVPTGRWLWTSADKLNNMFFIWSCIRRLWLGALYQQGLRSSFFRITTQRWRDILGGVYWKSQIPIAGSKFNPLSTPLMTWVYRLSPHNFSNDNLKRLLLWDLSLVQLQVQLDQADEILVSHLDPVALEIRRADDLTFFIRWMGLDSAGASLGASIRCSSNEVVGRLFAVVRLWPSINRYCWYFDNIRSDFPTFDWRALDDVAVSAFFKGPFSPNVVRRIEDDLIPAYCQGILMR